MSHEKIVVPGQAHSQRLGEEPERLFSLHIQSQARLSGSRMCVGVGVGVLEELMMTQEPFPVEREETLKREEAREGLCYARSSLSDSPKTK